MAETSNTIDISTSEKPAAGTEGAVPETAEGSRLAGLKTTIVALAPLIVGLAFGRAGLIAASYGSYKHTDENIFTDGPMIFTLLILLVFFAVITARKSVIPKVWVNRIARICIVAEVASIVAIGAVTELGIGDFLLRFALSTLCTLTASGAMYYWLRRVRGTGTTTSVVFVFSALILSEIELYATLLVPPPAGLALAAVLAVLQLPCMTWARGRTSPYSKEQLTRLNSFSGFDGATLGNRRLLITMAVGIGLLSIVTGFLRGYPDGEAIPFSAAARLAYSLLTIALSAGIIAVALGKRKRALPIGIFILLELLACLALLFYALFPDSLDIGAVFTTTLNALMVGFAWYIIVAFMSFGWRDPYYYAMAGWFVWLGARACTRMAFPLNDSLTGNSAFAIAATAMLIVMSTQATLTMFLNVEGKSANPQGESETASETKQTIVRIMGLDEGENLASLRQASMRHSAEIMGEQFLLSEREVDVLALYALGLTQKKVAEELFITPSTVHAHMKRIYIKTGLHSRQEILDYIQQYAS